MLRDEKSEEATMTTPVLVTAGIAVGMLTGLLAYSGAADAASRWVAADGKSCDAVCATAVQSGTLSHPDARYNGNHYFVCRASVGGQGKRAGYNLRPDWASACWVAHGGQEKRGRPYDCLCD
jgi:hypothetical protein